MLFPQAGLAETYLNNPGFCEADPAEQELADVVFLSADGVNSHAVSCWWGEAPQIFEQGRKTRLKVQCDNGSEQWQTHFDLSVNDRGRITLFSDAASSLPEYYFSCSSWGWKGGE